MKINRIPVASLRHLIAIDAPVVDSDGNEPQDSSGDPVREWQEYAQVNAHIDHLKANEILALQGTVGAMDTKFIIRRDAVTAQINPLYRIRFDGVIYNIGGIRNVEHRGVMLEITARSGVNDG